MHAKMRLPRYTKLIVNVMPPVARLVVLGRPAETHALASLKRAQNQEGAHATDTRSVHRYFNIR